MATVTTGSVQYNSSYVAGRLLVLQELQDSGLETPGYTLTSRTPTQIVYTTPEGTTLTFSGAGFNTGNALNLGTLNGATETGPGGAVFTITGINLSLSDLTPVQLSTVLAGNDTVNGGSQPDILSGEGGNDTINGGLGADTMIGGSGNDTYVVDNVGDRVDESTGGGTDDTVVSALNFSLSGPTVLGTVENLTLTGAAASGTGNASDNKLTGNAGANVLVGLDGNDTLNGGVGVDTLIGGIGDDTYVVDVAADAIVEQLGEGTDLVRSAVTFNLTDPGRENLENVTLIGAAAINATGDGGVNILTGNTAANVLDGGGGVDQMFGGLGDDTYIVDNILDGAFESTPAGGVDIVRSSATFTLNSFVENLTLTGSAAISGIGNELNNTITGNSGNNFLNGLGGGDTLIGGLGNDTYIVDNPGDVVTEGANAGVDNVTIVAGSTLASYTLTPNVENLIADDASLAGMTLTGNDLNNAIYGTLGNDTINGGPGADQMFGLGGANTYVVDNAGDVVNDDMTAGDGDTVQSAISYSLVPGAHLSGVVENLTLTGGAIINGDGNGENNVIIGNTADNTLSGAAGNDLLDGGLGNDTLRGGLGDDTFVVNAAGDVVLESANQGVDTVMSAITYSIENNPDLENVTLTGAGALNATGNGGVNVLTGNSGANVLDGRAGPDEMRGGSGNDTYVVDDAMDLAIETTAAGGVDIVQSSVTFTLALDQFVENLTLTGSAGIDGTGNALNNLILGNSGNNVLNGLGGADTLSGFDGDDEYVVDHTGDVVSEVSATGGLDTIYTSVSYTLPANVEVLINDGGTGSFTFTGNGLSNNIRVTHTNANNDTLNGGAGADRMEGGYGNDVYMVDNAGDVVFDADGLDRVESSVDFSLVGTNVEDLTLLTGAAAGHGSDANNRIIGNAQANTLSGANGNDVLDGGAGLDLMRGGAGDDTYFVDNAGDIVEEEGEGNDTIFSSVTLTAASLVENVVLTGAASINATGNNADNSLTGNSGNNVLDGGSGVDTMSGGLGNDTYDVDDAADEVIETTGGAPGGIDLVRSSVTFDLGLDPNRSFVENVTLIAPQAGGAAQSVDALGNDLNNALTGNDAANVLDGRKGADTMAGGLGDDTYRVDQAGDLVTEAAGANTGIDTVIAEVSYTLTANVENLVLDDFAAALNGTGNAAANVLNGNDFANQLNGLGGSDTMSGGFGDDTYFVESAGDVVVEVAGAGTDTVVSTVNYALPTFNPADPFNPAFAGGEVENLTLTGAAISATGNALANRITGNANVNALIGGSGDDVYVVNATADVVLELNGLLGGDDTVESSATYTLSDSVERLTLTGTAAINGTGNGAINTLTGNSAANTLDGLGGADTMAGGAGNDTYIVDHIADEVQEDNLKAGGIDEVRSSVDYTIGDPDIENLTLTGTGNVNAIGNDGQNVLTGNSGNNVLNGMGGSDLMIGGAGDDTYHTDSGGDRITELAGGGTDKVITTQTNHVLQLNVENGELDAGVINGNLFGNAQNNSLTGNGSNNVLDGAGGADVMTGLAGNDTYMVDNAGDAVNEIDGDGTADKVFSTVSITLFDEVENLQLTGTAVINGTGNDLNNEIIGNSQNNVLSGLDGNDVIDGRRGADAMSGGDGDDDFYVDNTGDTVVELAGPGSGIDRIFSTVSYTMSANVEDMVLQGNRNINGTGSDGDNYLEGNAANNRLDGGIGVDELLGEDGNDVLVWDVDDLTRDGGAGEDTLLVTGANASIDPSVHNLTSIERIDLTGSGSNTLTIDAQEVLAMSDAQGVVDLVVRGNTGDVVNLDDVFGAWDLDYQTVENGIVFNVYVGDNGGNDAYVYIQSGVTVNTI